MDTDKIDTLEYDWIQLGWENLKKLINSLGIAQVKLTLLYDFENHILYLTEKETITKTLDRLHIDYDVMSPTNTEVYMKKVL